MTIRHCVRFLWYGRIRGTCPQKDSTFFNEDYLKKDSSSNKSSKNADSSRTNKDDLQLKIDSNSKIQQESTLQSNKIEISKTGVQSKNTSSPFAINIDNNIIGNTASDSSNGKSTSISKSSVNSDQNTLKAKNNSSVNSDQNKLWANKNSNSLPNTNNV